MNLAEGTIPLIIAAVGMPILFYMAFVIVKRLIK